MSEWAGVKIFFKILVAIGPSSLRVAKSAMAAPFFLVANAGQLRPRDVYQTHFASSA